MHPDACISPIAAAKFSVHYARWVDFAMPPVCLLFVIFNIVVLVKKGNVKSLIFLNFTYIVILIGALIKTSITITEETRKWRLIRIFGDILMPLTMLVVSFRLLVEAYQNRFLRKLVNVKALITAAVILAAALTCYSEVYFIHANAQKVHDHFDCIHGQYQSMFSATTMPATFFINCIAYYEATAFPISKETIKLSKWYIAISAVSTIFISIPNVTMIVHFNLPMWHGLVYFAQKMELFNTIFQFFITCGFDQTTNQLVCAWLTKIIRVISFGRYKREEKVGSTVDSATANNDSHERNSVASANNV